MAPSPTGKLHLGNAYTFLFNYLFARKNRGDFLLRLEDTDRERSKQEFEDDILESLSWLGLLWDGELYRSSERLHLYQQKANWLIEKGRAYYCFCSVETLEKTRHEQEKKGAPIVYPGTCRNLDPGLVVQYLGEAKPAAVRFKMPADRGMIEFADMLHGKIAFDSSLLGDMVIMRSNGAPLYNFAVVVDDIEMEITHVLRGDDHVSNTPKQIVIFEAFGSSVPTFAHFPNILNPDRIGKLSKRHGATSVSDYRRDGFLPEAVINYMALLGWTMPGDIEIMSQSDMEQSFDVELMRISPAAFNIEKLEWLNGEYIRMLSDGDFCKRLESYLDNTLSKESTKPDRSRIELLIPLVKTRMKKLSDFIPLTFFLFEEPEYDLSVFEKVNIVNKKQVLERVVETLETMERPWRGEVFEKTFREMAASLEINAGDFFQLLRVAFSGQLVTPPLFECMKIFGEERTVERIRKVAFSYPNFE